MMKFLNREVIAMISILFAGTILGQNISGTVSDSQGPLPGVNVVVLGSSKGTLTDLEGKFILNDVDLQGTLEFSFMGYATQMVEINGRTTIDVLMSTDETNIEEVIVIGYGNTKAKDATGAIGVLKADDFSGVGADSPSQLLRGKASGVQVTQSSGEPGAGVAIRIRGNNTLRAGSDPLIVIDGVILSGGNISRSGATIGGTGSFSAKNPLNFINQEDIQSISVLKDASSTAIYGSRGANGVIVITTKKGKYGKPQFSYSNNFSFNTLEKGLGLLTSEQYASRVKELGQATLDRGGREYDWKNAILRDAYSHSHNFSMTSGSEFSNYRLSIGYSNNQGIVKNTGLDKYTINFTNSAEMFNERIKLDVNAGIAQLEDERQLTTNDAGFIGNILGSAWYWNPTIPIFKSDGGSYTNISDTYLNPVELLNSYQNRISTTKIIGSFAPKLSITNDLKFEFLYSMEFSFSNGRSQLKPTFNLQGFYDRINKLGGFAELNTLNAWNHSIENVLRYVKEFSSNFRTSIILGYSFYDLNRRGSSTLAKDFNFEQTNLIHQMQGAKTDQIKASSFKTKSEYQSVFFRTEMIIYQNLLANISARLDGSSRFGPENEYGFFPAVGLGYKLVEDNDGIANYMKVRASWGIIGNQDLGGDFLDQSQIDFNNGVTVDSRNSNKNLKWEETTSYSVGFDFSLFNYKLNGNIDYFQKNVSDLIIATLPESTVPNPSTPRYINSDGELETQGVEVLLNYNIVSKQDFKLSIGGNMTWQENEMKNQVFTDIAAINGQGLSGAFAQALASGYPIYSYYLREWAGYDKNGTSLYVQPDGSLGGLGTSAPKFVGKQALPKVNLGFDISTKYKNIDLSINMYGAFGHYIYNNTKNAYFFKGAFLGNRNVTEEVAFNSQARTDPNSPSTAFLESGDFLRLANVSLGYSTNLKSIDWIKSLRIFLNANNLLLITSYSGLNPEVNIPKTRNGIPSAGIDYLAYPNSKGLTMGVNVKF